MGDVPDCNIGRFGWLKSSWFISRMFGSASLRHRERRNAVPYGFGTWIGWCGCYNIHRVGGSLAKRARIEDRDLLSTVLTPKAESSSSCRS